MPKTWKISQISLQTVRAGSTSLSDKTLIKAVPSVSKSHSALALNSPASVITILFFSAVWGKCMYTFEMASKPCRVKSDNIFASIQRKNMSSSILSASSSSPPPASSLSSVFITYRSAPCLQFHTFYLNTIYYLLLIIKSHTTLQQPLLHYTI